MNLYWVTTEDHDEDWFVIAKNSRSAASYHELYEGYCSGDATAEKIIRIPDSLAVEKGWPTSKLMKALGAKCISKDSPRIVELNGRVFCEGLLDSYILEIESDRCIDQTKH